MFDAAVKGNSMRRARIEGPISYRTPLVGGERMEIEFAGNTFLLRYLDEGNMNPRPENLESPLVDRKSTEVEFSKKCLYLLNWKNNWSLLPTPHVACGLEE